MSIRSGDFDALTRIVACPSASSVHGLDGSMLDRVVDLAIDHKVVGSLVVALRHADREVPPALAHIDDAAMVNHLRSMAALKKAARALDDQDVRWAVVKGPVMASRWPHGATQRGYNDLDLLVDPSSLRRAIDALCAAGFDHRNHNWEGFRILGVGEVPLDDGNVVIDLHWSLLGLTEHRRSLHLPTGELLARSVPIEVGQLTVPTLDVTDTLVHLGVHHALAGARYLGQLMDIHLVARLVDPGTVLERSQRAGATRLVGVTLDRAERLYGPIAPGGLGPRLVHDRAWLGLNRAVDRGWRTTRRRASTPFPGALIATGRSDRPTTARALASKVAFWARGRIGARTLVSEGGPLDWQVDAGGSATYERFLDEVAQGRYGR
jgi:hypothetical protein